MFAKISKNIVYSTASFLIPAALVLITTPIVRNGLGDDLFGIWAFINSLLSILYAFNTMSTAGIKFLAEFMAREEWENVEKLLGTTLLFDLVIGLLSLAVTLLLPDYLITSLARTAPQLNAETVTAFRISGLAICLTALTWWGTSLLAGLQRYDWLSVITTLVFCVTYTGNALVVSWGWGLTAVIWVNVIVLAVSFGTYFILWRKLMPKEVSRLRLDWPIFVKTLKFGIFSSINTTFGLISQQLDRVMITALFQAKTLTFYSLPKNLAMYIHQLCARAMDFICPMSSELDAQNDREKLKYFFVRAQTINTILVVLAAVPLFIFSYQILSLWMDDLYAQRATVVFQFLIIAYSILGLNVTTSNIASGLGYPQINAGFGFALGSISLLSYLIFIPPLELNGGGIAVLAAMVPTVIGLIIYVRHKLVPVSWWQLLKSAFLAPVIPGILIGLAFSFLAPLITSLITLILALGACCLSYLLAVYFFNIITREEKELIQNLVKQGIGKLIKKASGKA